MRNGEREGDEIGTSGHVKLPYFKSLKFISFSYLTLLGEMVDYRRRFRKQCQSIAHSLNKEDPYTVPIIH